ncbi:MAG: hypothetical protein IJQ13_06625 [Prevotella sp.]|nr:hypothetical protein [Prevotella sp.]
MLKNEFEELTGLSMTEEEFNGVNALYMACGDDTDKGEFCKLYMDFEGRLELMHRIEREHQRMKDELEEHKLLLEEAGEIRGEVATSVLEISSMSDCDASIRKELYRIAFWLVGTKEVIKRKVKRSILLSPTEIEYVIENLK